MLIVLTLLFAAPVPALDAAALKKEQEANWADLAKEEKTAARALLKFSNRPKETVAYFKATMKPLIIDEDTVKKRIADLASDDEKVWKPAFETFQYFDPRLALGLQAAFDASTPGVGRQRLVAVLGDYKADQWEGKNIQLRATGDDSFNFTADSGSWWAEHKVSRITGGGWGTTKRQWTRAERAIVLLEHIGTLDAIAVLKSMATGHAEAAPTKTAKESLKRLKAD
jgi:hypothetical protein